MSDKTEIRAVRNVLINLTLAAAFITVEVIAALQLDGWVSVALWTIVGINAVRALAVVIGLAVLASRATGKS